MPTYDSIDTPCPVLWSGRDRAGASELRQTYAGEPRDTQPMDSAEMAALPRQSVDYRLWIVLDHIQQHLRRAVR